MLVLYITTDDMNSNRNIDHLVHHLGDKLYSSCDAVGGSGEWRDD